MSAPYTPMNPGSRNARAHIRESLELSGGGALRLLRPLCPPS
ncbi:MAG: hypothetical protein ACREUG_09015 [Steroidobacteraceae bacterium]